MKKAALALLSLYAIFTLTYLVAEKIQVQEAPKKQEPYVQVKEQISADSLYTLVNSQRTAFGIGALSRNTLLDEAARVKCSDMLTGNYYGHVNPTTGKHGYEIAQQAIANDENVSENLNRGVFYKNNDIITSWLNSPSHKAAMLDPKYVDTGVAVCESPAGTTLAVQFFASYLQVQQSATINCSTISSTHQSTVSGMPYSISSTRCR